MADAAQQEPTHTNVGKIPKTYKRQGYCIPQNKHTRNARMRDRHMTTYASDNRRTSNADHCMALPGQPEIMVCRRDTPSVQNHCLNDRIANAQQSSPNRSRARKHAHAPRHPSLRGDLISDKTFANK